MIKTKGETRVASKKEIKCKISKKVLRMKILENNFARA